MLVRLLKSFYMVFMFFLFAAGILFELAVVLPVILVVEIFSAHQPRRMQQVHSLMFKIWLGLMDAGGMLKGKPVKGRCFEGPCIIIANHPGLFDVLFLIRDIPGLTVMVKRSLTKWLPLGWIFKSSGYILAPGENANPVESLLKSMEMVGRGYKFLLFPEGTRSPAGGLRCFKGGAFKIAQKLNVPIQPVLIINTPPFLAKGEPWYLFQREPSEIEIQFLDLIHVPRRGSIKGLAEGAEKMYQEALGIMEISQ